MTAAGAGPAAGVGLVRRAALAWALVWRAGPVALLVSSALSACAGVAPVAAAWFTRFLLDELVGGRRDAGTVLALALALGGTGLVVVAVPQVGQYVENQLGRDVDLLARDRLFAAVDRSAGLARFETPLFHDQLQLAQQASQGASSEIVVPTFRAVQALVTAAGFVGTLVLLNPAVTVLVLLAVVPLAGAHLALSRRQARLVWTINPTVRRQLFYAGLLSDVGVAKEVRLFGLGAFLRGRMLRELRVAGRAQRALDRRTLATHGLVGLLGAVVATLGLVWAVRQAAAGRLTVGEVSVFVAALAGLQAAADSVVGQVAGIYQALLVFGHYRDVVWGRSDLPVPARPAPMPTLRRGIELDGVWFRYDEAHPWVLRGVDLVLPAGATTALVGLNGAGKSTLVKLLCRFYDPQRGAVRWDGVDLRDVDPDELRRRISAVFQDYVAYELTAAENIGLGELRWLDDRPRIAAAAGAAGIDGALGRLPHGYDTLLSRTFFDHAHQDDPASGVLLSGGQWQRIALARAYLRDRRDLLVMDEPSAGLDADAEHALHEDLRRHRAGRTSLLISHRLSAVRDADRIVVLRDGRVCEQGSHADLVAGDGEYARLFRRQASAYDAAECPRPA